MRVVVSLIAAAFLSLPLQAQTADLILTNATIYTGEGFAQDHPQTVQALAVASGKILAAGSNEVILQFKGPKTIVRNLDTAHTGVYVFPGFNDAHTHLGEAGKEKMNIDLSGVHSLSEMLAEVRDFARNAPPGHWLVGGGWDQTQWPDKSLPTRQQLDAATPGHPTFLSRIDGHIAIANSAALDAAHITSETAPPAGGAIDRDVHGQPTGILRESAKDLVANIIPPATPDERRRGLELAIADALSNGVTSVQDFSDWQDFLTYEEFEHEGKLNLRISEGLPYKASLEELQTMRAHHPADDPLLHTGMLKGFMDGSLGSHTAAMRAPYSDDPANTGLPQYPQSELNEMAVARSQAGYQFGFHAIGDKAASMALDAYQAADKFQEKEHQKEIDSCLNLHPELRGRPDVCGKLPMEPLSMSRRFRIEHAQVVDPADIPRFRQLGVIASMQPSHLLTDMNWAEARLGPKRAAFSYAWKESLPRCRRPARLRYRLSRRAYLPVPRPLRRRHPHE